MGLAIHEDKIEASHLGELFLLEVYFRFKMTVFAEE